MKAYRKKGTTPMEPWTPTFNMFGVSVSEGDTPGEGGMIARDPKNPSDRWYVAKAYFEEHYEEADG